MKKKKWEDVYGAENTIEDFIGNIANHSTFLREILDENPKRVLEIGSGSGTLSIFLSHFNLKVTSIDNNEKVIKLAKKHNELFSGKVKFVKQNAFKMTFKNDFFDLVYHQGFLEHFFNEEIIRLLKEQLRVAPLIVFSVPNKWYGHRDVGDERLLSKKEWEKVLSEFNIVKSENYYTWPSFVFKRKIFWLKPTMYLAKIKR
jgi:2-polyprenyl-3-methyl-5-hydroxy-6-metoxy-1,4-benzoquinol methylase